MNDMNMTGFNGIETRVEAPAATTLTDADRLRRRAKLSVAIVLGLGLGAVIGLITAIGTGLIGLC